MMKQSTITTEDAKRIGDSLGIDWRHAALEQFRMGLILENEYVVSAPEKNRTESDMSMTGKIALAHLKEFPNYYARLATTEAEAEQRWSADGKTLNARRGTSP